MSAIVFDFDGTIVDSRKYFIEFISKEAGRSPLTQVEEESLYGLPLAAVAKALGMSWWRLPRLYFKGRKRMDAVIRDLEPFEDMPKTIKKLHAEGHELFIISSNSIKNIRVFLKKHKLREHFVEIYGGVEVFGKASMFHRLLREHGFKPNELISVGDEIRDIEAAQSVKVKTVAVTWGFARAEDLKKLGPDAMANTPEEIIMAIAEL
jgi:phosphoglycolate phosphatase